MVAFLARSWLAPGLLTCSLVAACDGDPQELSAERKAHLRALAHDYQFKVVDERESAAIRHEIRKLDPASADQLHEYLVQNTNPSPRERLLGELAYQISKERGKSFIDGTKEDEEELLRRWRALWESDAAVIQEVRRAEEGQRKQRP
jgi:hypothetical protein